MALLFDSGIFSVIGLASELLVGAKLYWYTTGTSTPLATYSDEGLTVPNANPVVASADGRFPAIWLQDARYKLVLKSALGVTLVTRDPIIGTNPLAPLLLGTGASLVGYTQAGGGTLRTVQDRLREKVSVKDFGALGNDTGDDAAAIRVAIAYCQTLHCSLYFPPGTYRVGSTIALAGDPITIVGDEHAPMQQGSTGPAVILAWHGGASAMFTMTGSDWGFIGIAFQNFTTATRWLTATNTQRNLFSRLSFVVPNGANQFSDRVIRTTDNSLGYSVFDTLRLQSPAPVFCTFDGTGQTNGITPMWCTGDWLIESNSLGNLVVWELINTTIEALYIDGRQTQNQQANNLCLIDTRNFDANGVQSVAIGTLVLSDVELDVAATPFATQRWMYLKAVQRAVLRDVSLQGGGVMTSLINATAGSTVVTSIHFSGGAAERIAGPLVSVDTTSQVSRDRSNPIALNTGNVQGLASTSSTQSGYIALTYGTTVTMQCETGRPMVVRVTNATAWTLTFANPTGGYAVLGEEYTLIIENTSGAPGGVIAVNAAIHLAGAAALVCPATGSSREYRFRFYPGAIMREVYRQPADVVI